MGLGRGSAIASFPEGSQLDRLTAHLLGTALPPLQSLTRAGGGYSLIFEKYEEEGLHNNLEILLRDWYPFCDLRNTII